MLTGGKKTRRKTTLWGVTSAAAIGLITPQRVVTPDLLISCENLLSLLSLLISCGLTARGGADRRTG